MTNRLAVAAIGIVALAPFAMAGTGASAPVPGDALIAQAHVLAGKWGRCPTARPAARALALAERTTAPRPRVRRARVAVGAWKSVATECSQPVDQPTVTP